MATSYYFIKNQANTTLLLTVNPDHDVVLQKYSGKGDDNQKWNKIDNGDGTFHLASKQAGRNLQMGKQNTQATATDTGGSSLQFPGSDATSVNIRDQSTKLVLGVPDLTSANPPVMCVLYSGANDQVWQFEPAK